MKRSVLACACLLSVCLNVTAWRYFSPTYLVTSVLALTSTFSGIRGDYCSCSSYSGWIKFNWPSLPQNSIVIPSKDEWKEFVLSNSIINSSNDEWKKFVLPICEYVEEGNIRPTIDVRNYLNNFEYRFSSTELKDYATKNKKLETNLYIAGVEKEIEKRFGSSCKEALAENSKSKKHKKLDL